MKTIGILTNWNVPNYGAFLQAYALQKVISSFDSDYDVRQIAYLEPEHYRVYYKLNNVRFRFSYLNPRTYLNILKRLLGGKTKALKSFLRFYKEFLPHTEDLTKKTITEKTFDTIVLGSDIIWDYSIRFFNNDEFVFGNHLKSNNIISYAPSFGTVKNQPPYFSHTCPEYVKRGLKRLSAISVRDENSRQLVKQYVGRNALVVCDPTILWDFQRDKNILPILDNLTSQAPKYIVVYGSFFTHELIQGVVAYAKKNGLRLICLDSLDDAFDWCDENIKQNNLNPFQWLSYFKYAEMVFTCTYHGLLFGLIFNKKTIFNPTEFILDKATSFIKYIGLEDVLVNFTTFEQKADWNWDYDKINVKLDEMREKSLEFLKDSI